MHPPATGGDPQIIVQFDGSAHRTSQVGGAGAALLQFDGNGLALLDWDKYITFDELAVLWGALDLRVTKLYF